MWNIKSIQKIRNLRWLPSSMDLEVPILMNWPETLWSCYTHIVLIAVQLAWRLIDKNISFELNSVSFSTAVLDPSSFGRKLIWLNNWCPNELNFLISCTTHRCISLPNFKHIGLVFWELWIFLQGRHNLKTHCIKLDYIATTRLSWLSSWSWRISKNEKHQFGPKDL